MRYRDLVRFDPVETVVQLRWADDAEEAGRLVSTYVISERMAEIITGVIVPHLRLDRPADGKGLLVVGNYGSGKSHLLSFLSAVAQWPEMRERVGHPEVARALEPVAGRFQVLRMEVGATRMPLRDIVLRERLEPFLHRLGVEYTFPELTEVSNTKEPLLEAVTAFRERYPAQGLLIVVDELLDYLRGRDERALILDLSFLREVGEVCRLSPFRFVAGVQEVLFDSPRFPFAADAVRRVRARFEQVRITRQDVAYVVAERLLRKTEEQRAWIRQHLQPFTPYYGTMAERLEEFVRLFPIHPAYLEVFERIPFAEQRGVLKAISQTVRPLLDREVPEDAPGIVSYDAYWPLLAGDPAYRASPEVREVVEKGQVLSDRIARAYTRPQYRPLAQRLIAALGVLRLTTEASHAPIGATPEELRDGLALFDPHLPEQDADFLRDTVETALREIIRTVSGQFISVNPDNGQYYLDLKKGLDYDAKIEERAEKLRAEDLNRYYFDALEEALGLEEQTRVPGFRTWEYEVPWPEKRVTRLGYLVFGTPPERSTAQPPRDFYLHFLQPFETPPFRDEGKPDELFFRLVEWDGPFERALRTYAGAWEMGLVSSGAHRRTYREKAEQARRELIRWLRTHPDRFIVTYRGDPQPLLQRERRGVGTGPEASFGEIVRGIAVGCLVPHFEETYPEYPAFRGLRRPITRESRPKMVEEALRSIAGHRTQTGVAILEGLELLDGDRIRPDRSPYARYVLDLLAQKGPGQVLNRGELLEPWMGTERMRRFRIEPEYVVVVLMALVHAGEVEITLPGRKIDAAALEEAARIPLEDLQNFRHIAPPKELPLGALVATFELLDLMPGLIQNPATHEAAVAELQTRVEEELERVVTVHERVRQGLQVWSSPILQG
ncbi:MAG: ATP-binding protein, partial [Chloroflexi bacterium]